METQDGSFFDEIVVDQENYILPAYIIVVDKTSMKWPFGQAAFTAIDRTMAQNDPLENPGLLSPMSVLLPNSPVGTASGY